MNESPVFRTEEAQTLRVYDGATLIGVSIHEAGKKWKTTSTVAFGIESEYFEEKDDAIAWIQSWRIEQNKLPRDPSVCEGDVPRGN